MLKLEVSATTELRKYQPEDAAMLFRAVDANRTHLRQWLIWVDATRREEDSLSFIRQTQQDRYDQEGLALGIFREGELIGGIGMSAWNHGLKKASIGYWLIKDAEGKGIMQACAAAFIRFLFGSLQLNKVELHHLPGNKRSAAVAARLGFRTEGILRDSFLLHGGYQDLVITGLLRSEWQAT